MHWLLCSILLSITIGSAQDLSSVIADLSIDERRSGAIQKLIQAGPRGVQVLTDVVNGKHDTLPNQHALKFGAAEALCRIQTDKAIPFLIENVSIQRMPSVNPRFWNRSDTLLVESLPAVRALRMARLPIVDLLGDKYENNSSSADRLAIILVLVGLREPGAREMLESLTSIREFEQRFSDELMQRYKKSQGGNLK